MYYPSISHKNKHDFIIFQPISSFASHAHEPAFATTKKKKRGLIQKERGHQVGQNTHTHTSQGGAMITQVADFRGANASVVFPTGQQFPFPAQTPVRLLF